MTASLRSVLHSAVVLSALALAATRASAQGSLREQTSALGGQPQHIISLNPFLPLAGLFQAEYERRVQDNLSVALSGSHTRLEDSYTSADLKLRFYPTGRALQGFGLAMGVGVGRIRNDDGTQFCIAPLPGTPQECNLTGEETTGPTASVEAQYQWLLGRRRATAVTAGAGVKRYYVDDELRSGFDIFQEYVPTLRLTIGYAFR